MVLRIGHRGAMGHEPENTLRSIKKAIDLGVDMIEFDVFECKSGELVLIHDERLDRTTNGKGYVTKKTLSELKLLDAGKLEKIPTLIEALDLIDKKVKVNIELKGKNTALKTLSIIEDYITNKGWTYDHFIVSSFDHYQLKDIKSKNQNILIGALAVGILISYSEFAQKLDAYSIHLDSDFLDRHLVEDAHNRGLKVFTYTVNHPDEIQRMKDIGVDGIFTNYPERL